jgi:hypothetical protein
MSMNPHKTAEIDHFLIAAEESEVYTKTAHGNYGVHASDLNQYKIPFVGLANLNCIQQPHPMSACIAKNFKPQQIHLDHYYRLKKPFVWIGN